MLASVTVEEQRRLNLENAARHEAGHAVCRLLFGYPATNLRVSKGGTGICERKGEPIRAEDLLRITLGGPVAEWEFENLREWWFLYGCREDLAEARRLLEQVEWLRPFYTATLQHMAIDEALDYHIQYVSDLLEENSEVIDLIAEPLAAEGELLAGRVQAIFDAHYQSRRRRRTKGTKRA